MKKAFRKIVAAAVAVLLSPIAASAGSIYQDCSPCGELCDPCDAVCSKKASLWEVGGWIDAGVYGNEYGQDNEYANGIFDTDSGNTEMLQNTRMSGFSANQMWVYAGKKLSKRGWDIGGRVDMAYGTDMLYLQSANLEYDYINATGDDRWGTGDYYLALPQAYGEIGYNNVSVKFGKFLSTFGYESIMSPDRFFYSMCYAYAYRPATQTGVLATWDVNKNLSVFGGWTNGQNQTFENEEDNAFLGGFNWKAGKRVNVGYSIMAGTNENPWLTNSGASEDYLYQSFFVDVKLTKRLNYVFEWTLNNETVTASFGKAHLGAYGINNELFYKLNKHWTFGARFEWMHVYDSAHDTTGASLTSWQDDMIAVTLGLNWKPNDWFTLRPEVRYDVFDEGMPFNVMKSVRLGNYDPKDSQFSGGISAVVHF